MSICNVYVSLIHHSLIHHACSFNRWPNIADFLTFSCCYYYLFILINTLHARVFILHFWRYHYHFQSTSWYVPKLCLGTMTYNHVTMLSRDGCFFLSQSASFVDWSGRLKFHSLTLNCWSVTYDTINQSNSNWER